MNSNTLRIGIDVGSARHRVAVGLPDGHSPKTGEIQPTHPCIDWPGCFDRISVSLVA